MNLSSSTQQPPAYPEPFNKRKILIVDDEKVITDTLARYFKLEGFDTLTCNSAYEALRLIHANDILIVITDIAMPGMDGVELLRRIKQSNGMIQVIMMTGFIRTQTILTCMRLGADDCLLKPLDDLDEMTEAVRTAQKRLAKWHQLLIRLKKEGI